MLTLLSVVSVLIPPAPQGTCNVVFLERGSIILFQGVAYATSLFSVRSKMATLCLGPGEDL